VWQVLLLNRCLMWLLLEHLVVVHQRGRGGRRRWQPHLLQRGAPTALHQAGRRLTAAHGNYIKVFDCVLNQNRLQTETDANEIDNEKEGKTERKAKTIESCYSGAIVFVFVFGIGIGIFEFRVVFVFGRGFRWFFWIYCVVGWLGLQRRGRGK